MAISTSPSGYGLLSDQFTPVPPLPPPPNSRPTHGDRRTDSPMDLSVDALAHHVHDTDQMSSGGGTPGSYRGGSGKRKAAHSLNGLSDGDDDHGSPGERKVRKRNRAQLSCTECKRRKIKCDRKIPCLACCSRGQEAGCHWSSAKVEAPPQPFTLVTDHERLKHRVAYLESIVLRNNPSSSQAQSNGASTSTGDYRIDLYPQLVPTPDQVAVPSNASDELHDSDTEDAALVLEELALGRKLTRVGSRARKGSSFVPTFPPSNNYPHDSSTIPAASRVAASLLVPPLDSRRRLVLNDIWKDLPLGKPTLDFYLQTYFQRADWAWHLHHKPTFLAEYEAFLQLVAQGRKDEIDPLWLSAFCATLCLSVNSLDTPVQSPLVNITEEDLKVLPAKFFDAAVGCLEAGDWTGKPRIRTLQAITLFVPYLLFAGTPAAGERHQTFLGAGLRIAQQLGLHMLSEDPRVMPPEDPALPSGINTLRREIALRIFGTLRFLEYMSLPRLKVESSVPPNRVTSPLPGNFNDTDLSADSIVAPQPVNVPTDTTFEIVKIKIALQHLQWMHLVSSDADIEYDDILDLDRGYRLIIETLPPELKEDHSPPLGEELTTMWLRAMISQTYNSRVIRLHRPFMARGYRESKYRYSTDAANAAARCVLIAQQNLHRAPLVKSGFQLLHIQSAVVVLFMYLWTTFEENVLATNDIKLIREALPFFEKYLRARALPVQTVAHQSLQVMTLLFEALEKRHAAAQARVAAGGSWTSEAEEESYGRLLKRVGEVVVSAAAEGVKGPTKLSLYENDVPKPLATSGLSAMAADPSLAPQPNQLSWVGFGPDPWDKQILGLSDPPFLGQSVGGLGGLAAEFDLSSLAGPEYNDPQFDVMGWNALDQFAHLGSF